MAVTTLSGANLRALRPLVLEALDSRHLRGVLADLIDAVNPDLARRLRLLKTYELALKALDCGRFYELDAAAQCRGMVRRYEGAVRNARWNTGEGVRVLPGRPGTYHAADEECCGHPKCACRWSAWRPYRDIVSVCVRRLHCLALVWTGLDGRAVPPDVESGLAGLRESIRSAVAQTMR